MGIFDKIKAGLSKTKDKLVHEIQRIVTRSPKLTQDALEELEAALIAADLGHGLTGQIVAAVKTPTKPRGPPAWIVSPSPAGGGKQPGCQPTTDLIRAATGPTIVSIVGVNGTGKTTTSAKLAHFVQSRKHSVLLAACDTFRAAAIEQIKLWGQRLKVEVIASAYGADAASVGHDAVTAALARRVDFLFLDTAGRLHTKHNLMQELQKLHRVIGKQIPGRRTKCCWCWTPPPV